MVRSKATVALFLIFIAPGALFADANSTNNNPPGPQCPNNLPDSEANKPLSENVPPCRVRNISHVGAKIRILKGALREPTTITIRPLEAQELPTLGEKLTNITAGERAGYRIGPYGLQLRRRARVTLEYDVKRLPEGATAKDVRVFRYDGERSEWIPLETAWVDAENGTITARMGEFSVLMVGVRGSVARVNKAGVPRGETDRKSGEVRKEMAPGGSSRKSDAGRKTGAPDGEKGLTAERAKRESAANVSRKKQAKAGERRRIERTYRNDSYYTKGLLSEEVVRDKDGRVVSRKRYRYRFVDPRTGMKVELRKGTESVRVERTESND